MNIYKAVPRFSPSTGEPIEPQFSLITMACDFCGHVYTEGYMLPTPTLRVVEGGNIEAQYHEDNLKIIVGGKEVEIDLYEMMNNHSEFIYCQEWCEDNADTCELNLVRWWLEGDFLGNLLCHAMYTARYAVIQKLIGEKGYSLEELNLEIDN